MKGVSGGYTIQIDVTEDNIMENNEFQEKKCC